MYASWESSGQPDIAVLRQLVHSDGGFYLRLSIPKQFGGLGLTDWRYHAVITEELENSDIGSFFLNLGNDMVLSYFTKSATPAQQARWLPKIVKEGSVIAIAMSEPELGSDLATLATTAKRTPEGWVLNGRKMWISAGATADIVVISAVTDASKGSKGISLFAVEKGTEGFESAKRFAKLGKHASDTCLLTLENVKVPLDNLLGLEGEGFKYMMSNLSKERLSIAVGSAAAARRALALTLNYVHGREMFGGVLANMQSVQQKLAALRTEIQLTTTFVDSCITAQSENTLSAETASMAKVAATELANRVADSCLQMFGGYGYLKNNPVGKIFVDQRVTKICQQTSNREHDGAHTRTRRQSSVGGAHRSLWSSGSHACSSVCFLCVLCASRWRCERGVAGGDRQGARIQAAAHVQGEAVSSAGSCAWAARRTLCAAHALLFELVTLPLFASRSAHCGAVDSSTFKTLPRTQIYCGRLQLELS